MPKQISSRLIIGLISLASVITLIAGLTLSDNHQPTSASSQLKVVAAESFWGSLVSQLGGSKVQVSTIITDPNADPHEYESNANDARAFATANYVIINGAGYDSWAEQLLSASPSPSRKVLNVATLLHKQIGDNPHFWYSPSYVNQIVTQIKLDLISLDPRDANYFTKQYNSLKTKLSAYQNQIIAIRQHFAGTKVASTEDIFVYLAQATGLNLISPPAFMQAVAEGNDPPANSLVQFQQQLSSNQVKLLVYNQQTITPLTNAIRQLAIAKQIPVIGVSETIEPTTSSFEDWMNAQITSIDNALKHQSHV